MIRQDSQTSSRFSRFFDWFGPIVVVAVLSGFFWRAVFGGKFIAKLDMLRGIDALYNSNLKEAIVRLPCDPSGPLIFYPFGQFAHESWIKLVVPLWNPYIGCGYPLVGDPQSFIFSVAHLFGFFSSPGAYNLGLLTEILVGALGVFYFARNRSLSVLSSVFAGLTYALVPRNLAQVDLSGAECIYPWLFLLFARLAHRPTFKNVLAASGAVTVSAYSSHPETAFFAVLYATVFALVVAFLRQSCPEKGKLSGMPVEPATSESGRDSKSDEIGVSPGPVAVLRAVAATAVVSLCLTAPLTMPFFEFLKNAYFYKAAAADASFIDPALFLSSLYSAPGTESYFLGAVALTLLPCGMVAAWRTHRAVLVTALVCLLFTVPLPLLQPVLAVKPLSYIATLYGIPELLLLLALLCGIGLDDTVEQSPRRGKVFGIILSGLTVAIVPCVVAWSAAASDDSDLVLQALGQQRQLIQALSWISLGGLTVVMLRRVLAVRALPSCAFAAALLVLNLVSQGAFVRSAIPTRDSFKFGPSPVSGFENGALRTVAVGPNLFLANTNSCFRVPDIRCFSPLVPLRYHEFVTACGAVNQNLYFQSFPDIPSKLLDLASVGGVLTRSAVAAEEDLRASRRLSLSVSPGRLGKGVWLKDAQLSYDAPNAQIDGTVELAVQGCAIERFAIQFLIADEKGNELRSAPYQLLRGDGFAPNRIVEPVHVPVSLKDTRAAKLGLVVRLMDTWTGQSVVEANKVYVPAATGLILSQFSPTRLDAGAGMGGFACQSSDCHFQLARDGVTDSQPEPGAGWLRLYSNKHALPAAYSIGKENAVVTDSAEASLSCIRGRDFDAQLRVCIEDPSKSLRSFAGAIKAFATGVDQCRAHDSSTVRLSQGSGPKSALLSTECGKMENAEMKSKLSCVKSHEFQRPDSNTVIIHAECDVPSFVVLTDLYYPGWRCTVDDRETTIYPANYLFRGVEVPQGRHTVRFVYVPASFFNGLWVSLICLLGISLIALLRLKKPILSGVS